MNISLYTEDLILWNNTHNLMAKNEISNIDEHIEDSLSLIPLFESLEIKNIIDIGSGGGFPVIPLAFWAKEHRPDLKFIATDIVDKKIAFLKWCGRKFDLNLDVVKVDKKFYFEEECIITSRAFASVKEILSWQQQHAPNTSQFFLLKGNKVLSELQEAGVTEYTLTENPRGFILQINRHDLG
ncbi:MAG: 16S rRNA (guanine(527)-N(7))-methyltransferase RsmG [Brevinema sp.]